MTVEDLGGLAEEELSRRRKELLREAARLNRLARLCTLVLVRGDIATWDRQVARAKRQAGAGWGPPCRGPPAGVVNDPRPSGGPHGSILRLRLLPLERQLAPLLLTPDDQLLVVHLDDLNGLRVLHVAVLHG